VVFLERIVKSQLSWIKLNLIWFDRMVSHL
jgi:hypothetical protein